MSGDLRDKKGHLCGSLREEHSRQNMNTKAMRPERILGSVTAELGRRPRGWGRRAAKQAGSRSEGAWQPGQDIWILSCCGGK